MPKIPAQETVAAVDKLCHELKQLIAETKSIGGPNTPEGKATSARNSLKHGFNAAMTVLPGEDAIAYDMVLRDLRLDHRPRTTIEDQCLQQMGHAYWKLRRVAALEKALWDAELETGATAPIHKMAAALLKGSNISAALDKLQRYETASRRTYHQAEGTFRRHQKYAVEALDQAREKAVVEEGERAVIGLDSLSFLRLLELRNLAFPEIGGTNSAEAQDLTINGS